MALLAQALVVVEEEEEERHGHALMMQGLLLCLGVRHRRHRIRGRGVDVHFLQRVDLRAQGLRFIQRVQH